MTLFSYLNRPRVSTENSEEGQGGDNALDHRRLVIVHVEVVGRGEERHHGREPRRLRLAVHPVPDVVQPISRRGSRTSAKEKITHPESCASCARMMESRLLRSRKLHAAVYLRCALATPGTRKGR
jgi:hypothetical protein